MESEQERASDPIVVVLAADATFTKQLAVALWGISEFAEREHDVYIFHDGYESAVIDRMSQVASNRVNLHWCDARSASFDDAQLPSFLPIATLFRLRMGDLLPSEVERAIYLDTDIAICQSLDHLWETELDGRTLGAVRDSYVPWVACPNALPWKEFALAPETPYFNAGVLVVDLHGWRTQGVGERALALLEQHRFTYGDQCALNAALAGSWAPIEPRWNLQSSLLAGIGDLAWITETKDAVESAIDQPAIVHYTNSPLGRPWQYGNAHPYRGLWLEQLDSTPWGGWRPTPDRSPLIRGAGRRIRRAGAILIRGGT